MLKNADAGGLSSAINESIVQTSLTASCRYTECGEMADVEAKSDDRQK